jgi:hypothetical protein
MVNAIDRECPCSHPGVAVILGHRNVYKEDMGARHLRSLGPGVSLAGRDGKHIDSTRVLKSRMGDVGGKPAINAVAVIENRMIGSHLGIVLGES